MTKFYAGMLVGFFLATALMFGLVQLYIAPHEQTIKTAQPYAQEAYTITHSEYYANAQNVAVKVRDVAASIAALPVIGPMIGKTQVEQYANTAVTLFENAKQSSEVVVLMIGWMLFVIGMTMPALLFSILMIIVGVWIYKKDCEESCACEEALMESKPAKAATRAKGKRKR